MKGDENNQDNEENKNYNKKSVTPIEPYDIRSISKNRYDKQ